MRFVYVCVLLFSVFGTLLGRDTEGDGVANSTVINPDDTDSANIDFLNYEKDIVFRGDEVKNL